MTLATIKRTWTTKGWKRIACTPEEIQRFKCQIKRPYEGTPSFGSPRTEIGMLQSIQNEIMYGPIGGKIDALPGPLYEIVCQPYEWYVHGKNMFRVMDPITQAKMGEWGFDNSDMDTDAFEKSESLSRTYLEAIGAIRPDEKSKTVTDILGNLIEGQQIAESPHGARLDMDISQLPVIARNGAYELSEEEAAEEENQEYEDDFCRVAKKTMTPVSYTLSQDVKDDIRRVNEKYSKIRNNTANKKELKIIQLDYEQALDQAVNQYLTVPLNSPFCGRGYTQPKKRYTYINLAKQMSRSLAAEERERFFYQLFGECSSCSNFNDLFGTPIPEDKRNRKGGFYDKIRDMYAYDKKLNNEWSLPNMDRSHKQSGWKSAFEIQRNEFINTYRQKKADDEELVDEEYLRKLVWRSYDRIAETIPAIYKTNKFGKRVLFKKSRTYKDSRWRQDRTDALEALCLTKPQWDAIYKLAAIIKERVKLTIESTQDRIDTLDLLAKHFRRITNLYELHLYMEWAQKRKFLKKEVYVSSHYDESGSIRDRYKKVQSYDFSPSRLDKISILDEHKWRKSCVKKRNYLTQQLMLFCSLEEQVISSQPTQLPEVFLSCSYMKKTMENKQVVTKPCTSMASGIPIFYEIEDGKGLLGVKCEDCGHITWLLDYGQKPELISYQEAVKEQGK